MRTLIQVIIALSVSAALCTAARAQDATGGSITQVAAPGVAAVAATVNGQPITELAVQRGLKRLPPEKQAAARKEILDYLIDNMLVDQYLQQLHVDIAQKDVDDQVEKIRQEITKSGNTFEKVMGQLLLTEDELRAQITADLRYGKFSGEQITEKEMREIFAKNLEMFDGTMVRARHILLSPTAGDAQAAQQAKEKLAKFKQEIEAEAAKGLSQLPADLDTVSREKARCQLINDAFVARVKESACPSKEEGGDLGWFPRAGSMVEPFARAAFALKPYAMSDVLATQFGYHLILIIDRRPGKETKFEDVKEVVRDVCSDRLREDLCAKLKPNAKIVLTSQGKP